MLTDHKIKSITLVLESAEDMAAVSITTTDDATYSEAATEVSSVFDVNGVTMPSSELTELKSIVDSLVATHESLVGIV